MPNHLEEVWREQNGEWREREEANVEKVTGANPGGGHRGHRRESGLCQSDTENHWSVLGRQMTQSDLYL